MTPCTFFGSSRAILWDRSSATPLPETSGLLCLWSSGFIRNRRELAARTGTPADASDADLLLRVYERYGTETPGHIAGPFAWVLWDGRQRRLLAVRDRLGTRGVFYVLRGSTLHLAGSVEPLLPALPGQPAPDPQAILAYLQGSLPDTFFRGLLALSPGEMLVATPERIERRTYWRPEPQPLLRLPDDGAYAAAFRERLFPVIAAYAPNSPAGVTLSSGLDSTTVAAALRTAAPGLDLTAFSWVTPELPEADESRGAEAVARTLGIPLVPRSADQHWPLGRDPGLRPPAEGPPFTLYADALEALYGAACERGVTVLFSGYGGDNLFGGDVFSYPDLLLTGRWRRLAAELREHLPVSRLGPRAVVRQMILGPLARTLVPSLEHRRPEPLPWIGPLLRPLLPDLGPVAGEAPPRRMLPGRRDRLRNTRHPLLTGIARVMTAHAASCGIDLRHPLLDHEIVEFALSLPSSQTFAAARRKIVVRNAMRGLLPDETIDRREKIYPEAIARRGLAERETAKVWAMMTDMKAAALGFVDEARLREEYRRYLAGETRSALFWHTLTLEAWLRRWIP